MILTDLARYCKECGAYIPSYSDKCLACGWARETGRRRTALKNQKLKAQNNQITGSGYIDLDFDDIKNKDVIRVRYQDRTTDYAVKALRDHRVAVYRDGSYGTEVEKNHLILDLLEIIEGEET